MRRKLPKALRKELAEESLLQEQALREMPKRKIALTMGYRVKDYDLAYPEAEVVYPGVTDFHRTLYMPSEALYASLSVTKAEGYLYMVSYEADGWCFYRPPDGHDPGEYAESMSNLRGRGRSISDECLPSLTNAKAVVSAFRERYGDRVDEATAFGLAELGRQPELGMFLRRGQLLYLADPGDYPEDETLGWFGMAERERFAYCDLNNGVEYYYRSGDELYQLPELVPLKDDAELHEYVSPFVEKGPVPKKYTELLKENEPYRVAHWMSQFGCFEVRPEGEWLSILIAFVPEKK